jgi:hypothetical protein
MRNHKYLFLITLTFFALGFMNIHFALLGIICMTVPIILLLVNKQKTWCQGYCPRASLFSTCGKLPMRFDKTPPAFFRNNVKTILMIYFGISLFFITVSTIRVATGTIPSMNFLKFLIVIPIRWEMPQLLEFFNIAPWITHLSYRLYSMMMTTTILGLILAFVYKPRTWCTVCPIATVSDACLRGYCKRKPTEA